MVVIAHQDIRMDAPAGPLRGLREGVQKTPPVDIILEDVLAAISTTHNVVKRPVELDANLPRHPSRLRSRLEQGKKKGLTPDLDLAAPLASPIFRFLSALRLVESLRRLSPFRDCAGALTYQLGWLRDFRNRGRRARFDCTTVSKQTRGFSEK